MKSNSQLSGVLHVLMHMALRDGPTTSESLTRAIQTNPVVVRRLMGGLRKAGFVTSAKGHGGGWVVTCPLDTTTVGDIHQALGAPHLLAVGHRDENPECVIEQAVNTALYAALPRCRTVGAGALARHLAGRPVSAFSTTHGDGSPRQKVHGPRTPT
ncbi:Rrf2 family transcriptional regulator [Hydrogenophaga sp.]|uniref:Rrf2 family transcriptional regulator n=1 Tax=Hydrogenophaga sp. TaxID=1904254 RepID=UPI00351EDAE6